MRARISVVVALAAAVGTVGASPSSLAAQDCQVLATPRRLPSVNRLVDSAALVAALAAGNVDTAGITLGLAYLDRAARPIVSSVGLSDSADGNGELRQQVQALVRAGGAVPGTNVRLHLRPPGTIHVERSLLCAPVPYDSAGLMQVEITTGRGGAAPGQRWKSAVRMRIGVTGNVLDARLQPGSGRFAIDRVVLEPVFRRRWHPATLDGRPVEVWLTNGRVELVNKP